MTTPDNERVLVLAPLGRDGTLICKLLNSAGLGCIVCEDGERLASELRQEFGCLLLTSEALSPPIRRLLVHTLTSQPPWSDLAIVLLITQEERLSETEIRRLLGVTVNLTLLARPVPHTTLFTVCQSLLQARRRQYQIRDLLAQLQTFNEMLEKRVRTRTEQVQALAAQLSLAEHSERKRVALILHDHVQQMLFGIQFRIHLIELNSSAAALSSNNEYLSQTKRLTEAAVQAVRTLAVELIPPVLEHEGLVETLSWLAGHVQEQHGLQVRLESEGDLSALDPHLSIIIYQMVRELLFNVVKHAKVDAASVKLRQENDQLHLTVVDHGVGYETAEKAGDNQPGFGLAHMQERIALFNGRMEVGSAPGKGTQVTLMLPLKPENSTAE
jgi:signal transduction histidine kinase